MIIGFSRSSNWISSVICIKTRFKYSHCATVMYQDLDSYVIESIGPTFMEWLANKLFNKPYSKQYGVVKTPLSEFIAKNQAYEFRHIEGDESRAIARLGMAFDMAGLICAGLNINYHNPKKDFCVETTSYAVTHIENHEAHRQTPKTLWDMSEPLI